MEVKISELQDIAKAINILGELPIPDFDFKIKITGVFYCVKKIAGDYNAGLKVIVDKYVQKGENGMSLMNVFADGLQDFVYNDIESEKLFKAEKEILDAKGYEIFFDFTQEELRGIDKLLAARNSTIPASVFIFLNPLVKE